MYSTQQIFQYGSELRRMMNSEAFEAAVNLIRESHKKAFFNSEYGDTAQREQAYRKEIALNELLDSLNAFVVNADQMIFDEETE